MPLGSMAFLLNGSTTKLVLHTSCLPGAEYIRSLCPSHLRILPQSLGIDSRVWNLRNTVGSSRASYILRVGNAPLSMQQVSVGILGNSFPLSLSLSLILGLQPLWSSFDSYFRNDINSIIIHCTPSRDARFPPRNGGFAVVCRR